MLAFLYDAYKSDFLFGKQSWVLHLSLFSIFAADTQG